MQQDQAQTFMLDTRYRVARARSCTKLLPVYWNAEIHTAPEVKVLHQSVLETEYIVFGGGKLISANKQEDWEKVCEIIAQRMISDETYFITLMTLEREAGIAIERFLLEQSSVGKNATITELIEQIIHIEQLFKQYDAITVPTWYMGGDVVHRLVSAICGISEEEVAVLAQPQTETHASQMEEALLQGALSGADAASVAHMLAEAYYWMPFGYEGPQLWNQSYFETQLNIHRTDLGKAKVAYEKIQTRRIARLREQQLIMKMVTTRHPEAVRLITMLQTTAIWTDERKRHDFRLFVVLHNLLAQMEHITGIPAHTFAQLTTNELQHATRDEWQNIGENRLRKEYLLIAENGTSYVASADVCATFRKIIALTTKDVATQVVGRVASKGSNTLYRGVVKVLADARQGSKVSNGDFIVATMTTPEFMPAMSRAAGFITDEGGVTCHAAIIAREMKKPCIIGTKIATQVLKDGDLVEVDADTGIVRVL